MIEEYLKNSKIIIKYKKVDFNQSISNKKIATSIRDNMKEGDSLLDVFEIIYLVDNLRIKGFITIQKNISFDKINKTAICLRGGHDTFGMLQSGYTISRANIFSILPNLEYITFYTQYRGEASGQGFDEYGGSDVNDVLKLFEIINEFDFCDKENIVLMGVSRGGMMAYQLLTYNVPISQAIIISGFADKNRSLTDNWRKGWREYIIEKNFFDVNNKDELNKRSPVTFSSKIKKIPILIIHGKSDENVNVQDSIDMHNLLPQSKLVVYNDDHKMLKSRDDMLREITDFLL